MILCYQTVGVAGFEPAGASAEKPVSLAPLEFEEAVRDLLSVKNENKNGHREKQ